MLVGTISIEKSERLAGYLSRNGIKHNVLNAKFHEKEAEIIAWAGRKGAVTIATNAGGRGTDILLGGKRRFPLQARALSGRHSHGGQEATDPGTDQNRCEKDKQEVVASGGLHPRHGAPKAAGSTTSSAAAPDVKATRAPRVSTCPSKTI